jgi:polyphosphate glucokinase
MTTAVGVDIGGTGTKAGLVDLGTGYLVGKRRRVQTPEPATPESMVTAAAALIAELDHGGRIGVGFPAVVVEGVVHTANNIDQAWIGVNAVAMLEEATGCQVAMVNDADAAALCEARYGAARDVGGVVLVITFGTGIGSGLLHDGELVPNLELGSIEFEGHTPCEDHFAASAIDVEGLSWEKWVPRANRFLAHAKRVFSPELIVVGGGITKDWDEWAHLLDPGLGVVRASRINNAGIVGAATLVERMVQRT